MSNIEWTEKSWNPIVGCTIKSPGCKHCYAMSMAYRIEAMGQTSLYDGTTMQTKGGAVWTGKLAFSEKALLDPLNRRKPTLYFVNSMGDLFHEAAPDEWIDRVFAVMALCPQHTFQVLTKRADRMRAYFTAKTERADISAWSMRVSGHIELHTPRNRESNAAAWGVISGKPLPNVWLGVSVEDQKRADERIPDLLATPAAVRFLSCEPLLGPLALTSLPWEKTCDCVEQSPTLDALEGTVYCEGCCEGAERISSQIDWIIVGGESGPDARAMDQSWAYSLRDQCAAAGVPFFMKQMGGTSKAHMPPIPDHLMIRQMPAALTNSAETTSEANLGEVQS